VILVSPRGFCAGVERAVSAVERALVYFGPPVHVRRAIVHNTHVAAGLAAAGAVFVDELDQVPRGGVVVFGAHGVSATVREQARARDLRVLDATCPLVAKVHREVRRYRRDHYAVLLIGHAGHDEVVGTLGQSSGVQLVETVSHVAALKLEDPERVACVTQTTLRPQDVSPVLNALRQRFPSLAEPSAMDICYATRNRQAAVEWLARQVDVVLVVGDPASSNSLRLREAAGAAGCTAYLISSATELDDAWLVDAPVVGVSASASTPDDLVTELVRRLCRDGAVLHEETVADEHVTFRPLPMVEAGDDVIRHSAVDAFIAAGTADRLDTSCVADGVPLPEFRLP
jgi:4-hydroxy-3-methylbut-2-enyl diphosphate reductase